MGLKIYAVMGGLAAVAVGVSEADKSANYIPTEATVTSAQIDCYVKNRKSQLVEQDTETRAYMDCELAPLAAEYHGYSGSDVRQRVTFEYRYKSPVDGSRQTGNHISTSDIEDYDRRGKKFMIHAHKEDPAKRRF